MLKKSGSLWSENIFKQISDRERVGWGGGIYSFDLCFLGLGIRRIIISKAEDILVIVSVCLFLFLNMTSSNIFNASFML